MGGGYKEQVGTYTFDEIILVVWARCVGNQHGKQSEHIGPPDLYSHTMFNTSYYMYMYIYIYTQIYSSKYFSLDDGL